MSEPKTRIEKKSKVQVLIKIIETKLRNDFETKNEKRTVVIFNEQL